MKLEARLLLKDELKESFRLRHRVYCLEKKWISPSPSGYEIDKYDKIASDYLGLWQGNRLVGTQRLIVRPNQFMVDANNEYDDIGSTYKNDFSLNCAEISRLAIDKQFRNLIHPIFPNESIGYAPLELIRLVYRTCIKRGVRFLYTGTTVEIMNFFRTLIPFQQVSDLRRMSDGSVIEVAKLDFRKMEQHIENRNSSLMHYFHSLTTSR